MSDVMDEFPHLTDFSVAQIHQRYNQLKGDGLAKELSDDTLRELLALSRILRRRSSAPTTRAKSAKVPTPSLDSL